MCSFLFLQLDIYELNSGFLNLSFNCCKIWIKERKVFNDHVFLLNVIFPFTQFLVVH